MNRGMPRGFYTKLAFIIIVIGGSLIFHRGQLQATWANPALTVQERLGLSLQTMMGLTTDSSRPGPTQEAGTGTYYSQPGNMAPVQLPAELLGQVNIERSAAIAATMNQGLDQQQLNKAFLALVNDRRTAQAWEPLYLGDHLAPGSQVRAEELATNHYLSSLRPDGCNFRTAHPLEGTDQRLGENLYELFISADDIHLTTWRDHPGLLAEYLIDCFETTTTDPLFAQYGSQYLQVSFHVTDFQADTSPYVRMVTVLTFDTH